MKILQIQPLNINPQTKPLRYEGTNYSNHNIGVVSELPSMSSPLISFKGWGSGFAVDSLRKFNVAEYRRLSPEYITKIRQECAQFISTDKAKEIEEQHDIASGLIIKNLNEEYGKDNWVLISLGRSLSSIVNVIGYKIGESRAKQLPMTNANRFTDSRKIDKLENTLELVGFKNYLKSIGLSKKEVEESGKHYILTDFCNTGASILGGYKLLTSELLYGDNPRIHIANVRRLVSSKHPIWDKLESNLYRCEFKDYSVVTRCKFLDRASESFFNPDELSLESKLMRFRLLDNVMSKRSRRYPM